MLHSALRHSVRACCNRALRLVQRNNNILEAEKRRAPNNRAKIVRISNAVKQNCGLLVVKPFISCRHIQMRYFRHFNHRDNSLMMDCSAELFKLAFRNIVVRNFILRKIFEVILKVHHSVAGIIKARDFISVAFYKFFYSRKSADRKLVCIFISHMMILPKIETKVHYPQIVDNLLINSTEIV